MGFGLRQRGFSLVELMVALLVGLMVVGALLSTFFATMVGNRHGQALAQVTEDANIALNMLRSQISQVGYGMPTGVDGAGKFVKHYVGVGLVGCDTAFSDLSKDIGNLACPAGTGADSIALAYEADDRNSVMSTAPAAPLDCLGNKLTPIGTGTSAYYLNYSRFFLDTPSGATRKALYCRGPGNTGAQALVENIENMQVLYGVSNNIGGTPAQVDYYANATTLATTAEFAKVASVRVCLVVASTDAVMDKDPTTAKWPQYRDCTNTLVQPADGRMYRAFTTTIVLQNRLGVLSS